MARNGGIGILHRNLSITDQSDMADRVKRSEAGMITNPVTTTIDATVAEVDAICGEYRVSGPVSYTHLDVYKRQALSRAEAFPSSWPE